MKYKRLSAQKHRQIIRCFCADITATACAEIVGVNRNTVNSWYNEFRHKILLAAIAETRAEGGEFEVDESYIGARRVRGKRGCGAAGKTPVFGLLKRGGKVVVRIVSDCSRESLMPIIQGLVLEGSTIYSDGWAAYDGLIVNGYDHYRVFQCVAGATQPQRVCQGEEPCERDRERTNLWFVRSFAKRRLAKFNGCSSDRFVVHLMECQWRYNRRNADLLRELAKILKRY